MWWVYIFGALLWKFNLLSTELYVYSAVQCMLIFFSLDWKKKGYICDQHSSDIRKVCKELQQVSQNLCHCKGGQCF